jgi:hypothetical protein
MSVSRKEDVHMEGYLSKMGISKILGLLPRSEWNRRYFVLRVWVAILFQCSTIKVTRCMCLVGSGIQRVVLQVSRGDII